MTRGRSRANPIQLNSPGAPNSPCAPNTSWSANAAAGHRTGHRTNARTRLNWFHSRRPSFRTLAGAACGIWVLSYPVAGQEGPGDQQGPGDQKFSLELSQKFGANDNIRLDSTSVGTTYFTDTKLSFGFYTQTQTQTLEFSVGGVGRLADDPLVGRDSGFRDPTLALSYIRDNANARLSLIADYARPDLAFLDPLTQGDINDQDFFRGGGRREDFQVGIRLETGLQSPLGFEFDLNRNERNYTDTTDPLLVSNQTNSAAAAALFRFSQITQGRVDLYGSRYSDNATETSTERLTFGADREFSAISSMRMNIGYSEVVETFSARPGLENVTRGPIGSLSFTRLVPDGVATARFDSTLNQRGRQNTLEFGRTYELAAGSLEISLGATNGDSFNPRPIGRIDYTAELPTGSLNASVSRVSSISDTLSQATETTRADLGYRFEVNDISSLSFDLYYADITLVGDNSTGDNRQRASFYATYARDITKDWDVRVGYEYRYFNSTVGGSANSNSVFFTLRRDLDVFR